MTEETEVLSILGESVKQLIKSGNNHGESSSRLKQNPDKISENISLYQAERLTVRVKKARDDINSNQENNIKDALMKLSAETGKEQNNYEKMVLSNIMMRSRVR